MSGNIMRNETEMMNETMGAMELQLVHEDCNCSGYTMAAVASGLLLCLGIIIYALLVH